MFRFPGRSSSSAAGSSGNRGKKKNSGNGKYAELPTQLKKLRACMICKLIKSEGEFEDHGCDNCEANLRLAGSKGAFASYTSGNFEGVIAMICPEESWVAKWQGTVSLKPGLYAVSVRGEVEKWIQEEMAGRS